MHSERPYLNVCKSGRPASVNCTVFNMDISPVKRKPEPIQLDRNRFRVENTPSQLNNRVKSSNLTGGKLLSEKPHYHCCGNYTQTAKYIYAIVTTILFSHQILLLMRCYFKYETEIEIIVDTSKTLESVLPGATICNKNRIRLDAAFKHIDGLEANITAIDKLYKNSLERKAARLNSLMHFMKLYFRKYLIKHQLEDGPNLNKFVEQLSCSDYQFNNSAKLTCEHIERIVSAQGKGNCLTMFHRAAIIRQKERMNRVNRSPVSSSSNANFSRFVPLEIIKLRLNFDPDSYTDLRDTAAAELMIHDERTVPLMASLSYPLKPGHLYEIYIKKTSIESLPAPYTTKCRDYFKENVHYYHKRELKYIDFSHPLSRTQCIENCIAERVVRTCRCWPHEIPYWADNPLDHKGMGKGADNKGLNWCNWDDSKNGDNYEMCYHRPAQYCRRACRNDCVRDFYEVFEQAVKWPSMERIWTSDENTKKRLEKDEKCCASLSIRYTTLSTAVIRHHPRLKFSDLLGKLGGLMSIFVGWSIISLYDLFQHFAAHVIETHSLL